MKIALAALFPGLQTGKFRSFVLYGPHSGLVQSLMQEVVAHFSYQTVTHQDLEQCRYAISTPSLFGQNPLLTVCYQATASQHTFKILETWPDPFCVGLIASTCTPTLVRHGSVAVVPCYDCTLEESKVILKRCLTLPWPQAASQKESLSSITMDPDVFQLCAQWTKDGGWLHAAQWFALNGHEKISLDTAHAFLKESYADVIPYLLTENLPSLQALSAEDPLKLVRIWQKMLSQMWQLKIHSTTLSRDAALKAVTPAIFFKHTSFFMDASAKWSVKKIAICFDLFLSAEVKIKQNMHHATDILMQILLDKSRIV